MKKILFLLVIVLILSCVCKNKKPIGYISDVKTYPGKAIYKNNFVSPTEKYNCNKGSDK